MKSLTELEKRRKGMMTGEASDNIKDAFVGSLVSLIYASPVIFGIQTIVTLLVFDDIAFAGMWFVCTALSVVLLCLRGKNENLN